MSDMLQDVQVDLFLPGVKVSNRKQVFQILAKEISARTACPQEDLLLRLTEQEKAGTSAIGDNIALPHLQMKYLYKPFRALALLKKPISFEAPDSRPVDVICLVLSPEQDGPLHLRRISRLSRALKNTELRSKIRLAQDIHTVKSLFSETEGWLQAA
jgi:PTS system nitrogen regulatory IIA component